MKLMTDYLGEIEYNEDDVIHMRRGLYGFEELDKYVLVKNPDEEMPYMWLQSVQDERTSFIVTNPFYFVSDYDFELPDVAVKNLELNDIADIQILSMIVIPNEVKNTTMNLKSPIIINHKIKKAEQIILDGKYELRYKIFKKEA